MNMSRNQNNRPKILKERDHLGHLGVYGRIIFKWILKIMECEGLDWIQLAKDRVQWLNLAKTL
jgi:hypothetical protein